MMKKNIITIFIVTGIAVLLAAMGPVQAGERFKFIEMGESGQIVAFPMTASEITAEDAENARKLSIRISNPEPADQNMTFREMGESGQTVSFRMTAEEMAKRDADMQRQAALKAANGDKAEERVIEFEMADGQVITFPVKADRIAEAEVENRLAAVADDQN